MDDQEDGKNRSRCLWAPGAGGIGQSELVQMTDEERCRISPCTYPVGRAKGDSLSKCPVRHAAIFAVLPASLLISGRKSSASSLRVSALPTVGAGAMVFVNIGLCFLVLYIEPGLVRSQHHARKTKLYQINCKMARVLTGQPISGSMQPNGLTFWIFLIRLKA
jgi:hypothetical protein